MSDPMEPTDPLLPEELEYRGRGRPRLPEGQKRREKLVIALNSEEMREVMHAAADVPGGPQRIQDWARAILMKAARTKPTSG